MNSFLPAQESGAAITWNDVSDNRKKHYINKITRLAR